MEPRFSFKRVFGFVSALLILPLFLLVHHLFLTGLNSTMGIIMTLAVLLVGFSAIIYVIRTKEKTQRLFFFAFVSVMIFAAVSQIIMANSAIDIQLHDTMFVISRSIVIAGLALIPGLFSFLYFIFPMLFGRRMNETYGRIHFCITIAGTLLIFLPLNFMTGLPRRYYTYTNFESFNNFNRLSEILSVIFIVVVVAQLLFLFNFIYSIFRGAKAVRNQD